MWIKCGMWSVDTNKFGKSFRSLAYQSTVELTLGVNLFVHLRHNICKRTYIIIFFYIALFHMAFALSSWTAPRPRYFLDRKFRLIYPASASSFEPS